VNEEFIRVTGYSYNECIGKNCSFLQNGSSHNEVAVKQMQTAFKMFEPIKVEVLNYRKNGEEFVNLLTMKPVFDKNKLLRFYIGVQFDLTEATNTQTIVQGLVYLDPILRLLPDVCE